MQGIEEEIRALVAEILEKSPSDIDPNANFFKDLGADSMMALEILASIERKYRISIPEERLANLATLNDTIAVAKEFIGKKEG